MGKDQAYPAGISFVGILFNKIPSLIKPGNLFCGLFSARLGVWSLLDAAVSFCPNVVGTSRKNSGQLQKSCREFLLLWEFLQIGQPDLGRPA